MFWFMLGVFDGFGRFCILVLFAKLRFLACVFVFCCVAAGLGVCCLFGVYVLFCMVLFVFVSVE